VILVSGDLTMQVQIRCWNCEKTALSRHRVDVRQVNAADMEQLLLDEFGRRIPDIPVGWSMSGRDRLSCEECR